MTRPTGVLVIGEGMLELSGHGASWWLHHGGDVVNTAVHLVRLGHPVQLLTAVGDDGFSDRLVDLWNADGIDTSLVRKRAGGVGLYAITLDPDGERSFTYWRSGSAARHTFGDDGIRKDPTIPVPAMVYLSLITLAVMRDGLDDLVALVADLRRAGARVAFDTNYRPSLWPDAEVARDACRRLQSFIDIALPSVDDEDRLWGAATAWAHAERWASTGTDEVVMKNGANTLVALVGGVGSECAFTPVRPADSSGAGDAFNAGYLHARIAGHDPARAMRSGRELAGWAIARSGAIPAEDDDAPYRKLVKPAVDQ